MAENGSVTRRIVILCATVVVLAILAAVTAAILSDKITGDAFTKVIIAVVGIITALGAGGGLLAASRTGPKQE